MDVDVDAVGGNINIGQTEACKQYDDQLFSFITNGIILMHCFFVVDQNQNEAVQIVIKVQSDVVNGAVTGAEVMTGGVAEVSLNTSEPQTHDDTCK